MTIAEREVTADDAVWRVVTKPGDPWRLNEELAPPSPAIGHGSPDSWPTMQSSPRAVVYAQGVAAFHNGFRADPAGNSAERLGDRHEQSARAALARLASLPASSAEALDANALVVPMILDDAGPRRAKTAVDAYEQDGYRRDDGNAITLAKKPAIR